MVKRIQYSKYFSTAETHLRVQDVTILARRVRCSVLPSCRSSQAQEPF